MILALLLKIWQTLTTLGIPVAQWIAAHQSQIQKAIADLQAGASFSQVIADLFAVAGVNPKQATKAVGCADCCKAVCVGGANAILAIHNGDTECTMQALSDALLAVACRDPSCP